MKALKPTTPKKGDIVLYYTPRRNPKRFLVGSRLWYGKRDYPSRAYQIIRKGRKYRFYTLTEIVTMSFKKRAKKIKSAVYDVNPLFKMLSGGKTITKPLTFKETK